MRRLFNNLFDAWGLWLLSAIMIVVYLWPPLSIAELVLSSSAEVDASEPWRLLSYIFVHASPLHLAVNIIALIAVVTFCRFDGFRLPTVFFIGGLSGGIFYIVFCAFFGLHGILAGSSAAVFAVAAAGAMLYRHYWLLIIASAMAAIGLLGANMAGAVAHIGGVVSAIIYALFVLKRRSRQNLLIGKVNLSGFSSLSDDERSELYHNAKVK